MFQMIHVIQSAGGSLTPDRQEAVCEAWEECLGLPDHKHLHPSGLFSFSSALLPVHQMLHFLPPVCQSN